jgi:LuxR family glucitol operon transcriptional activator
LTIYGINRGALKKKILSRHPVITVLGDGGNGKSALALQTAYNLANSQDHDFDAIAWVTAKSSVLSGREIARIEGAITNSLAIFGAIADDFHELGEDPEERIERLLTDNTILLFIDNLETVLDDRLRVFAENLPGKSKLVFTSRVPLGSDLSVTVTPFNDNEALSLFRRLVDSYAIEQLKNLSDKQILKFTRKLDNKPLLIKWFARGVSSGLTPQSILANKTLAVQYCLENVFDKLSPDGATVAEVYSMIPNRLSPNVVQKLSGLSALKVEAAIAELSRFAIISNIGSKTYENTYEMSDFARRFLGQTETNITAKKVRLEYQKLLGTIQNERSKSKYNRYSKSSYTVRSNQEAMSKGELQRAYRKTKDGLIEEALKIIDDQKTLNSQYFEVFRVSAAIHTEIGETSKATDDYTEAIDLAPKEPQLRHWFAQFLMISLNDNEGAAVQFSEALELDGTDFFVFNDAIRNLFYIPDFEGAASLIKRAQLLEIDDRKQRTLILDQKCQLVTRQADQQISADGLAKDYLVKIETLQDILDEESRGYVDQKLLRALERTLFHTHRIKSSSPADIVARADRFEIWLRCLKNEDVMS